MPADGAPACIPVSVKGTGQASECPGWSQPHSLSPGSLGACSLCQPWSSMPAFVWLRAEEVLTKAEDLRPPPPEDWPRSPQPSVLGGMLVLGGTRGGCAATRTPVLVCSQGNGCLSGPRPLLAPTTRGGGRGTCQLSCPLPPQNTLGPLARAPAETGVAVSGFSPPSQCMAVDSRARWQ